MAEKEQEQQLEEQNPPFVCTNQAEAVHMGWADPRWDQCECGDCH